MLKNFNQISHTLKHKRFVLFLVATLFGLVTMSSPVVQAYEKSFGIPPAIYTSWSGFNTPIGGMTGYDAPPTMEQVWTGPTTVNWGYYDYQINQAQATSPESSWSQQPISLVIPPQNLDVGGTGTEGNPFNQLWAPQWAKDQNLTTVIKSAGEQYYKTWNYAGLTPHAVWFVTEAGKRYSSNPKVGVIRLYLGFQGETQPLKQCQSYWGVSCAPESSTAALEAFTKTAGYCEAYRNYIYEVGKAAAIAFPNKPVIVMGAPTGCTGYSSTRWKREMFERWQSVGVNVGFSSNSFASDWASAEGFQPNLDWAHWLTYNNLLGKSPLSVETRISATATTDNKKIHLYYGGLAAQHFSATSFFSPTVVLNQAAPIFFTDWQQYAKNDRASVILRDREYAGQSWNGTDGDSGLRGNFNIGAIQTNYLETPQACGGAFAPAKTYFDKITLQYKEQTCTQLMPTFASTDGYAYLYNWQARKASAGNKFAFQTTATWANNAEKLRVILASTQAGNVEVKTSGGQSLTVTLPANTWTVKTFDLNAPAGTVEVINNTSGVLYMHRIDWLRSDGLPGDNGGTTSGSPASTCLDNRADINCDGKIDLLDLNILNSKL